VIFASVFRRGRRFNDQMRVKRWRLDESEADGAHGGYDGDDDDDNVMKRQARRASRLIVALEALT
jgi:hypothetical protein